MTETGMPAQNTGGALAMDAATLNDRELLTQFVKQRDDTAFARIVQRHTGLVMGVCRRVLEQTADAEDAFQATFLVLARKAAALRCQESIGGWLHETAYRTSLRLRGKIARQREIERRAAQQDESREAAVSEVTASATLRELSQVLDEELARLPESLRETILLCQVEGLSRQEIAARLGISVGAVKDRLERGRQRLRTRLVRRGVTLSSTMLAIWLTSSTASASVTPAVAASTAQAAAAFAAGNLAVGSISATVHGLATGALHAMFFHKIKMGVVGAVSLLLAGTLAYGMLRDVPNRFDQGLRGRVESTDAASSPRTITIRLDEFDVMLNLDVASDAKISLAFEEADLSDLRQGTYVSLRLADDHRTVQEIHARGNVRDVRLRSVSSDGLLSGELYEDGEPTGDVRQFALAEDAIMRIGGLPAAKDDFTPGMRVPLELDTNGRTVNAIEAQAGERSLMYIEVLEIDLQRRAIRARFEVDDVYTEGWFHVRSEETIVLDKKMATLADLLPHAEACVRLSEDRRTITAIRAENPEPDDEQ